LPARASLLDLRATYALLQSNPEALNTYAGASVPKLAGMQAFGADILAHLPAFPFGLGVRYENFLSEKTQGDTTAEGRYVRTSVIVTKRWIDTGAYFGLIATGGISNDFTYEITEGGTRTKFKADSGFSASAGLEAGMNLVVMKIGAEAGYLYAPLGNLKSTTGVEELDDAGNKIKTNISGTYVRAVIGFGF
ncbi:MAG: hypothetical protein NDI61_10775, partial [Bdellovibrionaceae bacterium]|nr:hypothetical protein [Pseudobdellovibrionaceae bacterium]